MKEANTKKNMATIYCIRNIVDNKCYIGKTIQKVEKRWLRHIRQLNANAHDNMHLQYAWLKYGADSFEFSILEDNIAEENIFKREGFWIQHYNALNKNYGYNLACPDENGVNRYSDEAKQRMSETHLGEKNHNYGKPKSDEVKQKMSEAHKGKPKSEKAKQRMSEARRGEKNHNYGKCFSEAVKKRMSEAQKGKPKSEEAKRKNSEAHKGEKNRNAKLTEQNVIKAIGLIQEGYSCKDIADMLGVTKEAIKSIKQKRNWKSVWNKLEDERE